MESESDGEKEGQMMEEKVDVFCFFLFLSLFVCFLFCFECAAIGTA